MDLVIISNVMSLLFGAAGIAFAAKKLLDKSIANDVLKVLVLGEDKKAKNSISVLFKSKSDFETLTMTVEVLENSHSVWEPSLKEIKDIIFRASEKMPSPYKDQILEALNQSSEEGVKNYLLEIWTESGAGKKTIKLHG